MKIRQKMAMLLAAAMAFTAVPMVTMAKSDNSLTKGITVAKKDAKVTAASVRIEMKDAMSTTSVIFVNLANAKWDVIPTNGGAFTYAKNNDHELQVTIAGGTQVNFDIPLRVELTGGDATVAVDGNGTEISDMAPVVFARTNEDKATVKFGDAKNIYLQGPIADITIEEPFKGAIKTDKFIEVELDNSDYEFILPTAARFTLTRGFSSGVNILDIQQGSDKGIFKFRVSAESVTAPGRIEIKGVQIKAKDRKPSVGDDISVTVKGDNITDATAKVAKSTSIGSTLKMKDDKVVEVVAGTKKDITFKLVENVDDSILDNRLIAFTLDNGYFWSEAADTTTKQNAAITALKGKVKVKDESSVTFTSFDLIYDNAKDKKVVGFEFTLAAGLLRGTRVDEITVEDVTVYMPLDKTGDVKVKAEGRAIGEELSTVAVNIKAPVEITSEPIVVKVGLKEQKGGKIVIKETDKGMLKQGQRIEIQVDGKADGFKISDKPEIKVVEGDLLLDFDDFDKNDSTVWVKVKRASKTASVIEIKDVQLTVDRTVPQGDYDLKVKGAALQKDHTYGDLTVKKFIKVATPNTEDITANGLKKGEAKFVIGSAKYVVNGVEADMDGAVYLENGRTMVPVRYVANALGVDAKDIYFANNTVTVIAASKTITLTLGDKVAKIGGAPVRVMTAAPVLKDGRTYVPVAEIGALLGVEATWDAAAQTATFTNK